MTNIPKYRAYHKASKQMYQVTDVTFGHNAQTLQMKIDSKEYTDWFTVDGEEYDDIVIMQSTGLHDKNGVEIFQGDVVEFFGQVSHIVFQDGAFWVDQIKISSGNEHGGELLRDVNKQLKIIGNIHTTPELVN